MHKARTHHKSAGLLAGLLLIAMILLFPEQGSPGSYQPKTAPVKGMVTMVDLGAASCIPCKMMAPILERLEKQYKGKAAIIFIDLRYQREAIERFKVQAIPTQIFFDKSGKEISRHVGFMSEAAIVKQLSQLGVK